MSRVFFREWRKHRRLTLERAAELLDMSHANLSRIENGLQPYNETTLDRMAIAYDCQPADLLSRDPRDPEGIWAVWDDLRAAQKSREAIAVLRALRDSA